MRHTEAAGATRGRCKRLSVQFRGMGIPEQEIVVTSTVERGARRPPDHGHRRRAGRQPDHPQRGSRARAAVAGPVARRPSVATRVARLDCSHMLSERQQRILSLVVDSLPRVGDAGRIEDDRGALGRRVELRRRSAPSSPSSSAPATSTIRTLRRGGSRPTPAIASTPTRCSHRARAALTAVGLRLDLGQIRREVDAAMRETTAELSRMTDLLALATAPPPATARDPPRRGAAPAAAGGDGGRDRVQRCRHEAGRSPLRGARPRAGRVGVELSERAARRASGSARG